MTFLMMDGFGLLPEVWKKGQSIAMASFAFVWDYRPGRFWADVQIIKIYFWRFFFSLDIHDIISVNAHSNYAV